MNEKNAAMGIPAIQSFKKFTTLSEWAGEYIALPHGILDVTFREDANWTLDKAAAYNLNIVRKMAINTLRLVDVGIAKISIKGKRYMICANFGRYLDMLMAL